MFHEKAFFGPSNEAFSTFHGFSIKILLTTFLVKIFELQCCAVVWPPGGAVGVGNYPLHFCHDGARDFLKFNEKIGVGKG